MFFSVYTLGCKLNQLETEAISDSFCREGFSLVSMNHADCSDEPWIIVVNTCTVTSMAEQKARRVIRKAMKDHSGACFIITGCYAQMEWAALTALGKNSSGRFFVIPGERKDRILDLPRFLVDAGEALEKNSSLLPGFIASWFVHNIAGQKDDEAGNPGTFRFTPLNFSSHSRGFL
ncbi:MAG: tRNA (N(6)-L-threonylcarbamoyladenosine(37)-C(2))-methylthiotransferase MtaB, partial [Treponema sp.]|nr:tRNA (N(6)-L-threonylcarbamoyladenosine(37)-C(2))-methylthiotransferase MtaB [Treponema sp.]